MTKAALVGLASVVVGMCTVVTADPALADGKQGFRGHSHQNRLHSVPPQRFEPRRFDHKHHHGHHRFHGQGYGIVAPPAIIYSAPAYVPPAPTYVPTPVHVPSPPAYAPPMSSAPAPTETVIEFPNGRYELRGDGINSPHRWVWIPNPPDAPPFEATPRSAAVPAEPTRRIEVFRWTDESGAVHLTDRLDKVPEAYRAKVTKPQS